MSVIATAAVVLTEVVAGIEFFTNLIAGLRQVRARVEAGGELTEADRNLLKNVKQIQAEKRFDAALAAALADLGVTPGRPTPPAEPEPAPIPEP